MFSVIIPTMWRSTRTRGMLVQLEGADVISEVIVIDNDVGRTPDLSFSSKIKHIPQEENIYVNPAWNLGAKLAKEDFLCLLNDDISFDVQRVFSSVNTILGELKCIGVDHFSYGYSGEGIGVTRLPYEIKWGEGWGCAIFLTKEDWVIIPDELKIWFGDNWIVSHYPSGYQLAFDANTEMSATASSEALNFRIKADILEARRINALDPAITPLSDRWGRSAYRYEEVSRL